MKVGILGSGDVGRKLADGLIEIGYEIKIGTRDPTKENIVHGFTTTPLTKRHQ